MLLDPANPVRDEHYEHQIDYYKINASTRTLRKALKTRKDAQRYKAAQTDKVFSLENI